jgi:hypothetical protein
MTEKIYKSVQFISDTIEAIFDKPPLLEKKPGHPDGFIWQGETYRVVELISEWDDFTRRGRFAKNMQPHNMRKAVRRGSFGVGRFYFQVRTENGRIFELYYDRAVKNVDDKMGHWTLFRELEEIQD